MSTKGGGGPGAQGGVTLPLIARWLCSAGGIGASGSSGRRGPGRNGSVPPSSLGTETE